MATITDPRVVKQICRWRTRAEQAAGLIAVSGQMLPILSAIPCAPGADIINDDGMGGAEPSQFPFTHDNYLALVGLFTAVAGLAQNAPAMAALDGLRVRMVQNCAPQLPDVAQPTRLEEALHYLIRPVAPLIRAIRRTADDDARVTPRVITTYGLQSGDIIDEGYAGRTVAVDHVLIMSQVLGQMCSGAVNTDAVADAIDAACTMPLEVRV